MNAKAELLDNLISSLRSDPDAWQWGGDDNCYIRHRTGVAVWVSNGFAYVWQPRKIRLGFWAEQRLRAAFRHWRRVQGTALAYREEQAAILRILDQLQGVTRLRNAA